MKTRVNRDASLSINILSRVMAILILAAIPVSIGLGIDRWLSTSWLVFIGAVLAAVIFFIGIFGVAKQANDSLQSEKSDKSID
jgi:NADH:ubiquinone oxidoreductase subunit K